MTVLRPHTDVRFHRIVLALCAMLGFAVPLRGQQTAAQPVSPDKADVATATPRPAPDLSSPRAMMQSFLFAVQAASADQPERINDAVACLDTGELSGEDTAAQARRLAQRLHDVIQAVGVTLDDIPEQVDGSTFTFHRVERSEAVPDGAGITLFEVEGIWRFSAATLADIGALEKHVAQAARTAPGVDEAVPAARRSARATVKTFIESMNARPPRFQEAVLCLDPRGQDREAWQLKSSEFASTLKSVMDRIKLVVYADIPDAPDAPPYVWHISDAGRIALARVEEDPGKNPGPFMPRKGEWRFTPETIASLEALYDEWKDEPLLEELQGVVAEHLTQAQRIERVLPEWSGERFWRLKIWQWLGLLLLLPLGWLVRTLAALLVGAVLRIWLSRRRLELEREAVGRVANSSGILCMVVFLYYAIAPLGLPAELIGILSRVIRYAIGVAAVWVAYRYVDILGGQIAANKDVQLTQADDVLIPMLRKILKMFVVIIGVLMVCEWMGKEWTTLLGALGIGGVALAFAAQDTIGNFFGSITVLFDRPFGIGDWIQIGDVEGTVERVGFRSTRVRTFYNSVVTIPNSKMVNTQVDNYGARQYRRVRVMLSVTYSTSPEKIDAFCEGIRELIRLHPYTRKDYYHVYFNQFAASSLDILLYMFFQTPDWSTELRERHRLFLDILRLAERLGVEFAFPTQTVWLERGGMGDAQLATPADLESAEKLGVSEAGRLFSEAHADASTAPVVIEPHPRSRS